MKKIALITGILIFTQSIFVPLTDAATFVPAGPEIEVQPTGAVEIAAETDEDLNIQTSGIGLISVNATGSGSAVFGTSGSGTAGLGATSANTWLFGDQGIKVFLNDPNTNLLADFTSTGGINFTSLTNQNFSVATSGTGKIQLDSDGVDVFGFGNLADYATGTQFSILGSTCGSTEAGLRKYASNVGELYECDGAGNWNIVPVTLSIFEDGVSSTGSFTLKSDGVELTGYGNIANHPSANEATFVANACTDGDIQYAQDTKILYLCIGSAWVAQDYTTHYYEDGINTDSDFSLATPGIIQLASTGSIFAAGTSATTADDVSTNLVAINDGTGSASIALTADDEITVTGSNWGVDNSGILNAGQLQPTHVYNLEGLPTTTDVTVNGQVCAEPEGTRWYATDSFKIYVCTSGLWTEETYGTAIYENLIGTDSTFTIFSPKWSINATGQFQGAQFRPRNISNLGDEADNILTSVNDLPGTCGLNEITYTVDTLELYECTQASPAIWTLLSPSTTIYGDAISTNRDFMLQANGGKLTLDADTGIFLTPGSLLKNTGTFINSGNVEVTGSLTFWDADVNDRWFIEPQTIGGLQFRSDENVVALYLEDNNGNVGMGTTTPTHKLHIKSANAATLRLEGYQGAYNYGARLNFGDGDYAYIGEDTEDDLVYAADNHIFMDNGLGTGNVGIGTSAPNSKFHVEDSEVSHIATFENTADSIAADGVLVKLNSTSSAPGSGNHYIAFENNGINTGEIAGFGTNQVQYVSTSDGRLKKNINDLSNALETVMQMRPATYNSINESDNTEYIGFIAQELAEIYPNAVSGYLDSDPAKDPMGVAYGALTPVLTGAIKELNEKVDSEIQNLNLKIGELIELINTLYEPGRLMDREWFGNLEGPFHSVKWDAAL